MDDDILKYEVMLSLIKDKLYFINDNTIYYKEIFNNYYQNIKDIIIPCIIRDRIDIKDIIGYRIINIYYPKQYYFIGSITSKYELGNSHIIYDVELVEFNQLNYIKTKIDIR